MGTPAARGRASLTIGALSESAGVNIETIRYYERIHLLPAPPRTTGNQRIYDPTHRQRLVFIRRARELGFTIDDMLKFKRLDGVPQALTAIADGFSAGDAQKTVLRDRLAGLACPVQVLWGAADKIVPPADKPAAQEKPASIRLAPVEKPAAVAPPRA